MLKLVDENIRDHIALFSVMRVVEFLRKAWSGLLMTARPPKDGRQEIGRVY